MPSRRASNSSWPPGAVVAPVRSTSAISLRELPPERTPWGRRRGVASSFLAAAEPVLAADGKIATAWKSDPASGPEQYLTLDFGEPREFGGLVLRWQPGMFASRYDVQFSDDAREWRTVRSATTGRGDLDPLLLPEAETRYVRLALHDGPARAYALAEIEVRDLAFGATPNAFFEAVAREFPRGYFPRGFSGQQSTGRSSASTAAATAVCCPRTARSRSHAAAFRSSPSCASIRVVTWWTSTDALRDGYLRFPL